MMFVRDEGQGEPTLLLHGLGASSRVFDPLFAHRPAQRRLIAVDLPRTARSRQWARSEPLAIALELTQWCLDRKIERFHVFGHSFGGLVALALASQQPARVLGLTVASAPALGLPGHFRLLLDNPLADASMAVFGRLPAWRPVLRTYLSFIWGEPRNLADHHLAMYEEALAAEGFSEGMLEALRAVGRFRLEVAALLALGCPKRVVWGERDPLVPVIQGERLARSIGAEFIVLPNVGHCVPEEAPDAVRAAVSEASWGVDR